jgi:hypothetical protein
MGQYFDFGDASIPDSQQPVLQEAAAAQPGER